MDGLLHEIDLNVEIQDEDYSPYSLRIKGQLENNKWKCNPNDKLTLKEFLRVKDVLNKIIDNLYRFNTELL